MVILLLLCLVIPPAQAQDSSGWQLTEMQDLLPVLETYGEVNTTLSLSPDGKQLMWTFAHALCLYHLDRQEGKCEALPDRLLTGLHEYNRPLWSPDGAYIALSDDPFVTMVESDVWMVKLASGEFTNLTDDHVEGPWPQAKVDTFDLDYGLAWDPTSHDLYFFRSRQQGDWTLDLYRTYPGGSQPEHVAALTGQFPPLSTYFQPAISPDGKTMALIVLDQKAKSPFSGLWLLNLEDGKTHQVADLNRLQKAGFPEGPHSDGMMPKEVIWAGDQGLLLYLVNGQYSAVISWGVQFIDLTTGEVKPLVDMSAFTENIDLFQTGDDGHTPFYTFPRSVFVPPTGDVALYNHSEHDRLEEAAVSLLPLPPDSAQPEMLGEVPGCSVIKTRGMPRWLNRIAPNGRALLYNCLLTFNQP